MKRIFAVASGVVRELFRRKDFYLILVALFAIIIYAGTFSFGGEKGFVRYFKEIGISFTYVFSIIITVSFSARQIQQEIESKSIYPLLSKPISREEFIAGKFAGVWIISVTSFTLFYLVFLASLWLRRDFSTPWVLLVEGYYLHVLLLSFLSAFAMFLSLFLTTAANIAVTLLFYFGNNWFGVSIPGYVFMPHLEFFDIKEKIIHTCEIVPGWVILFLTVYAVCYCLLFLYLAAIVFKRRNL